MAGCMAQFYFHFSLGTTESFLLTAMSYDRYVAICNPLHYLISMSNTTCTKLLVGSWAGGFIVIVVLCLQISSLSFCDGNELDHYYCDFAALIRLSCTETSSIEMLFFVASCFVILGCFLLIVISYSYIIRTTMMFPTSSGRRKAFSTCASHLIVVCLFYVTNIIMFVRPTTGDFFHLNKTVSIIPSVVTPLLNPVIYTLRNQEVKEAVKKALQKVALKGQHNITVFL
ncbi:olfactory receptor 6C76-like [Pseudophryne corroboree]|uniref:olfactory receptor 6C76-like n=1 Tax=Pseudophryne corroboree TaxID=495146 RepID=UPI0030815967